MEEQSRIISSLKFNRYTVDEITFKRNKKLPENINSWKMDFNISSTIKCNKEKNKMSVNLKVEVFKNIENPPFTMMVDIVGYFELIGNEDIKKYTANAIAIMYPYLRAIVSTYTSASNVLPIILPAINVNELIKQQEKK